MAMTLSDGEISNVETITRVSAVLGIVSFFLITFFINFQKPRDKSTIGVLFLAIPYVDLVSSIAKVVGRAAMSLGTSNAACQIQGFFILFADLVSVIISIYMSLLIVYAISRVNAMQLITKHQVQFAILLAHIVPLISSLYAVLAPLQSGIFLIGDDLQFCFLTDSGLQFGLYYSAIWSSGMITIAALFYTSFKVKTLTGQSVRHSGTVMTVQETLVVKGDQQLLFVVSKLAVFSIAFLVTWLFPVINRIVIKARGSPIYALSMLEALFSPSRAIWNMFAFAYVAQYAPEKKVASKRKVKTTMKSTTVDDGEEESADAIRSQRIQDF